MKTCAILARLRKSASILWLGLGCYRKSGDGRGAVLRRKSMLCRLSSLCFSLVRLCSGTSCACAAKVERAAQKSWSLRGERAMSANRRDFIKFVVAGAVTAGCPIDLSLVAAQTGDAA